MPLLFTETLGGHCRLGVWQMSEEASAFPDFYADACSLFRNEGRRKEYVCVRALLAAMTGIGHPVVRHQSSGKPLLEGFSGQISISHTRGYCAVLLSETESVGVDVEFVSNRVDRIASHFMRPDETALDTTERLLLWSAKETMYKLFSQQHLRTDQMRIDLSSAILPATPFSPQNHSQWLRQGTALGQNLATDETAEIHYCVAPDYVLTFAHYGNGNDTE